MMSMSISYTESGRRNQKARTRTALIAAARELLRDGVTPTVEEAAEAASISRATAYRYFPNQHDLLVAAHPEVDSTSILGPDPPADPAGRLDQVVVAMAQMFLNAEESYRAMLRLSLEPHPGDRGELALRRGRRVLWIEDALEPLREHLPTSDRERLVQAIAAAIGIEALVTLVDLLDLSREQAVEVMRWSAQALLGKALEDAASRPAAPR